MKFKITAFFIFGALSINAQVGINTDNPIVTLDVKPKSTAANTAEGIIAPNLTREEIIAKSDSYGNNQTGAFVYVNEISNTDVLNTKTEKITNTGYYYFDGTIWQKLIYNVEQIYLPSFNLPLPGISNNEIEFDIYTNVYRKQFIKAEATAPANEQTFISSNPNLTQIPDLYSANQLDFVITYFDPTIITDVSITNTGVIKYKVLNSNPPTSSFINIVLVVK